jgi:nucleoside phosphorylase
MRIIYVARQVTPDGLKLGGRSLVRQLSIDHEVQVCGAIVDDDSPWLRGDLAGDVVSASDLDEAEVVYLEGGWNRHPDFDDRIPLAVATAFVRRGGQLVVADLSRSVAQQESVAIQRGQSLLRTVPMPDDRGLRYLDDERAMGFKNTLRFSVADMLISDWLRPAWDGIDSVLTWGAIDLLPGEDIAATGHASTRVVVSDVFVGDGWYWQWASVSSIGAGHVVVIGADVSWDYLVDECPDNARWLSSLMTLLFDRSRETVAWRRPKGSSVTPREATGVAQRLEVEEERMSRVDALVITALPEEFEAARTVAGGAGWRQHGQDGPAPIVSGEVVTPTGVLVVALARPPAMSGRSTGPIVTALVQSLSPTCLAMSGVCAGNPDKTAPGDVLIASPAYQYDEGKQSGDEFLGDIQQFPLEDRWLRTVQDYDPAGLPSYGPATDEEATTWLLERLLLTQEPRHHPARPRYFPRQAWGASLTAIEAEGFIMRQPNGEPALTDTGRAHIERIRYDDVDGPDRLPFAVLHGPMASGNAVMQDPEIWRRLQRMGSRRILGLEMEAATVATVAHQLDVPHWLIAKGVMDSAELRREDRFKEFAARASAEVLLDLLGRLLISAACGSGATEPGDPGTSMTVLPKVKLQVLQRLDYDWIDLADYVGVPAFQRAQFGPGEGARGVWEWLDRRDRLGDLPTALADIGREDLAELFRPNSVD